MDYEELKLNFCNLLCQISINDLEQFMKWIDKHIQGYNKYGLNYIRNLTSELKENDNNNNSTNKIINQIAINKNKINCECGRVYNLNITLNQQDLTTTTTTTSSTNTKLNFELKNKNNNLKRVSSTKLNPINLTNNNKKLKSITLNEQKQQQQFATIIKDQTQQFYECSLCHKKFDNIQSAGSHILKCNATQQQQQQSSILSSSSSSSIDKDENNNNNETTPPNTSLTNDHLHQNIDENNCDDINSDDVDDDTEYHNDIDELSDNQQIGLSLQQQQHQPITIPLLIQQQQQQHQQQQTPTQFKQETSNNNEINKIKCPICSKPYSNNHTMLRHKMSIHDKHIKYCCKICERSFFRKDKLATHISNHQDYDTYVCFLCECKLKSKQVLKTHFKKDHNLNGDEPNYNELILKCQLKETIDIDSNMIINYGDTKIDVLNPTTTTTTTVISQQPVLNSISVTSAVSAINDSYQPIENVIIKKDVNENNVVSGSDDTLNLMRNRKSLVYDILNTQFDCNNENNIDTM